MLSILHLVVENHKLKSHNSYRFVNYVLYLSYLAIIGYFTFNLRSDEPATPTLPPKCVAK